MGYYRHNRSVRKRVFLFAPVVAIIVTLVCGGLASAGPSPGAPREAVLTGAEVVPAPGDPDGTGMARFSLYPGKNKICYNLSVSNIQPATAAHLHRAPAGQVGPVVLNLKVPRDQVRECRRGLSERLIRRIGRHTPNYYVTIHNNEYQQGGALRGQLSR